MIRELYTMPAHVHWDLLDAQLRAAGFAGYRGTNQVDSSVAVYTEGAQDLAVVGAVVAAHVPPAFPPLDPLGRMATLSAILHADVEDWANASGIPAEHLVHEAEAWSLGA
jgi:hypothetical protein